jgi:hypothetical protein
MSRPEDEKYNEDQDDDIQIRQERGAPGSEFRIRPTTIFRLLKQGGSIWTGRQ